LYVVCKDVYTECTTVAAAASLSSRDRVTFLMPQIAVDVSVVDSVLLSDIIRMVLLVIVCVYVYVIQESIILALEASLANRDRVTCLMAQMSTDVPVK